MGNKHSPPSQKVQKSKNINQKQPVPVIKKEQPLVKPAPVLDKPQPMPQPKIQPKQQKKPQQPIIPKQNVELAKAPQKPQPQHIPISIPKQPQIRKAKEQPKTQPKTIDSQWVYKQKQINDNIIECSIILKESRYDWIIFGIRKWQNQQLNMPELWHQNSVFFNIGSGNTWVNGSKYNRESQIQKIKSQNIIKMNVDLEQFKIIWKMQDKQVANIQIPNNLIKNRSEWKIFTCSLHQQSAQWQS